MGAGEVGFGRLEWRRKLTAKAVGKQVWTGIVGDLAGGGAGALGESGTGSAGTPIPRLVTALCGVSFHRIPFMQNSDHDPKPLTLARNLMLTLKVLGGGGRGGRRYPNSDRIVG